MNISDTIAEYASSQSLYSPNHLGNVNRVLYLYGGAQPSDLGTGRCRLDYRDGELGC